MTAVVKITCLLLIVVAATGSPAWCRPAMHAPPQDQPAQPAQLVNPSSEGSLPVFLGSRGTPIDMTWLARRVPLLGTLAGLAPVASDSPAFFHTLTETGESSRGNSATASLIALHSQLTV